MELSKEQIELLKQVKNGTISTDTDYYFDNQILQDLMYKDKLIDPHLIWSKKYDGLVPDAYKLTVAGQNELSKSLEKKNSNWKDKILYPIITGTVTGVIGYLLGKFG